MSLYDKYILPIFLNCACGSKPINYQREKVVPQASGIILEVGIGSGLNIPFYDRAVVEKIIGLDPSIELHAMAKKTADQHDLAIDFIVGGAEQMDLPNDSVDTVLVTYTMCTIPDALSANKEMLRVLKPGGRLIFCEHGLAPDANVSKWQSRIDPFWGKIAGGCHLNRDIPELIRSAGFQIQTMDEMYLPGTPKFAGYNYWGVAVAS